MTTEEQASMTAVRRLQAEADRVTARIQHIAGQINANRTTARQVSQHLASSRRAVVESEERFAAAEQSGDTAAITSTKQSMAAAESTAYEASIHTAALERSYAGLSTEMMRLSGERDRIDNEIAEVQQRAQMSLRATAAAGAAALNSGGASLRSRAAWVVAAGVAIFKDTVVEFIFGLFPFLMPIDALITFCVGSVILLILLLGGATKGHFWRVAGILMMGVGIELVPVVNLIPGMTGAVVAAFIVMHMSGIVSRMIPGMSHAR